MDRDQALSLNGEAVQDSPASMMDCMLCSDLCLGASILPCGHLVCRKCLLHLNKGEGQRFTSPTCNHRVKIKVRASFHQKLAKFPMDVVMQRLVVDELAEQDCLTCCMPDAHTTGERATHACWSCSKLFCGCCAGAHQRKWVTGSHVVEPITPFMQAETIPSSLSPLGGSFDDQRLNCDDSMQQEALHMELNLITEYLMKFDRVVEKTHKAEGVMKTFQQKHKHRKKILKAYRDYFYPADAKALDNMNAIVQRLQAVRCALQNDAEADMQNIHQAVSGTLMFQQKQSQEDPLANTSGMWPWRLTEMTGNTKERAMYILALGLVPVTLLVLLLLGLLVPINTDMVKAQPISAIQSQSLSGYHSCYLPGQDTCFYEYNGMITDMLVTADKKLVISLRDSGLTFLLESALQMTHKSLGHCTSLSVAELPNGQIAVTCQRSNFLMFINTSSSCVEHCRRCARRIRTEKSYDALVANPQNNSLIAVKHGGDNFTIDILTLEGKVVRTLVSNNTLADLATLNTHYASLAFSNGDLFICGQSAVYHVNVTDNMQPIVKPLMDDLVFEPRGIATDRAGNLFIMHADGVLMRDRHGTFQHLLRLGRNMYHRLAVHGNRLLVAGTMKKQASSIFRSVVREYKLV